MARGGRGGGRSGRSGPQDRETLVSKKLSWLLRHGAEKEGLKLGEGGYVGLADVVSHARARQCFREGMVELWRIMTDALPT